MLVRRSMRLFVKHLLFDYTGDEGVCNENESLYPSP